ncbi:MAG: outer membrane protein assembly factor [Patescibacteria group bacterium]
MRSRSLSLRLRGILAFLAAILALAAAAPAGRAEDQSPMVIMVAIEGNKEVPTDEILAAVRSTQIGAPLNLDAVRADQKAIYDLGYFTEVLPPEFRKVLGGVKVVFRVVEFPLLKEIKITGLTRMPLSKALAVFASKPGLVINRLTLAKDLRELQKVAQEQYGLLLKSPLPRISPDGVVEISLVEMKLRRLTITGLEKTREEVVRREITAVEGEIFDIKTFGQDLQDLFMLGYFESIKPTITESEEDDKVDVALEFKERKTGSIMGGISYSTKDGELSGLLKVGDANLFGTGNRLSLALEINPDLRNIDLEYVDPWLDSRHTSLTLHLYSDFDGYLVALDHGLIVVAEENRYGGEIGLGRPLTRNTTLTVFTKHEYLNVTKIADWPPEEIEDPDNPGEMIPNPDYTEPPENPPDLTNGGIVTNSVSLQLDYAKLTPQEAKYVYVADGLKLKLSTEFAGGWLGGDTQYNRYLAEGAYFKSVSPRDVFALRLMGGIVDAPPGGDPLGTADFISGGAETLRGYSYRDFVSTQMALGNLEFRHRFSDTIEGVLFYDIGQFYSVDTGWQTASGYGLGVRVWVPYLGQLRFDYGWPTNGEGAQFYFSIGEVF